MITACLVLATALAQRAPVPDAAERKKAEALIRDAFRDEYAARDLDARKAFARRLLQEAEKTEGDPAGRYVLYREASDLAAQVGDPVTASGAIDRMFRHYQVDLVGMKADALKTSRRLAARTPEGALALARAYRVLMEQALALDAFEEGGRAAVAAEASARAARDAGLLEEIQALRREFDAIEREYRRVKRDLEAIAKKPDDPGLNRAAGRFRCLAQGRWTVGLPLLAKGPDGPLRDAASKDLAKPENGTGRMEVADAWWSLAQEERDALRRSRLLDRARLWYEAALPDLSTLARLQVERRLKEFGETPFRSRGGQGAAVNLLAWLDPEKGVPPNMPAWSLEGNVLASPAGGNSRLATACLPPAEYDVIATVERLEGRGYFVLGLVAAEKKFHVLIDYQNAQLSSISYFNRLWGQGLQRAHPDDQIVHSGPLLTNGKPGTVVCSVRASRLLVSVDGKRVVDYRNPPYETATVYPGFAVPDESTISLAVSGPFRVHRLTLRPVRGLPKRVR